MLPSKTEFHSFAQVNSLTSEAQEKPSVESKPQSSSSLGQFLSSVCFALITLVSFWEIYQSWSGRSTEPYWQGMTPAPLVMQEGDPYIRALMRTISASEANDPRPYSLLYGGEHISDFSSHPDICVPIVAGPNVGDCTTAAGRYQFLTTTWLDMAEDYHPDRHNFLFWQSYSFAPEHQDKVMYAWLSDPGAWGGVDISQMLRQGRLQEVLQLLSPTWTSLGYGIETNSMSYALPEIYDEMLQEELQGSIIPWL